MDYLDLFKTDMGDPIIGDPLDPPIVLGGPFVKHLVTKVKLYGDFDYETWAAKAVVRLGSCLQSFPKRIQFWKLGDHTDGKIYFRETHRELKETWTEPAEDIDPDTFESRLLHPDCTEVRFDMVIRFQLDE